MAVPSVLDAGTSDSRYKTHRDSGRLMVSESVLKPSTWRASKQIYELVKFEIVANRDSMKIFHDVSFRAGVWGQ